MTLSAVDRNLLQRCLSRRPGAWEEFVDRFLGLIVHVVDHTAEARGWKLTPQDREDLAAEVLVRVVDDDFAVLRRFRGESSFATYLTVISRRVVVRAWHKRRSSRSLDSAEHVEHAEHHEERFADREEVERLMSTLSENEAEIVKLYHLEGKSYQEISNEAGVPLGSIGPTLSRAREKMRVEAVDSSAR